MDDEKKQKTRRNTKQRDVVLEAVANSKSHLTADQLYLKIAQNDPTISRGTVFRNLNVLAESGEIQQVKTPGADRFDIRLDKHYHITCTQCGSFMDVALPYDEDLDKTVNNKTGYSIKKHNIIFDGVCPQCAKK